MFPAGYFAQTYFPTSYFFAGTTTISGELVWQLPAPMVSIVGAHGVAGAFAVAGPGLVMLAAGGTTVASFSLVLSAPSMSASGTVDAGGTSTTPWKDEWSSLDVRVRSPFGRLVRAIWKD